MFDCIHRTSDLTTVPDKAEHQLRVLSKEGTPYVVPDNKILPPALVRKNKMANQYGLAPSKQVSKSQVLPKVLVSKT